MKRKIEYLFFLILFGFNISGYGVNQDEIKLYLLDNATREDINYIEKNGGSVSRFSPNKFAEVYLNQSQFDELIKSGFALRQIIDKDKSYADSLYEATKNSANPMAQYHTYLEISDTLQLWAQQYSNIAQLHSIGKTVLGRDMWIMKISDNVSFEEPEPEFKYISTMHGDEVVGKEMLFELIYLLLSEYGTDIRITNLVNNTEIWIMPNMNFDGTELHQRRNANNVNLNRNFPDREYGNPPYPGHNYNIQPETQNMIQFTADHNFVLSANFHGGALVANYPWDKRLPGDGGVAPYAGSPDDTTFIDLALAYSKPNSPMFNSSIFPFGITNGAAWYEIDGGMQDWNYFEHSCMDITMEVSQIKWPPVTELPQFWQDNKESLLAYMEKIHTGISGIITDGITGFPLDAEIIILETGSSISTDPDFGDYYKVISQGTHSLQISADGYISQVFYNVVVDSFPATILDAHLFPSITVDGIITDVESNQPLENVIVTMTNKDHIMFSDTSGQDGSINLNVPPDTMFIRLLKENYFSINDTVIINSDTTINYQMQKVYPAIINGIISSTISPSSSGAIVYCQGLTDTLDSDSTFSLSGIYPGSVSIFAYLYNHKISRIDTFVANGDSLSVSFLLEPGDNFVFDDFENTNSIIHSSTGDWQKGMPTSGPMSAYSGQNTWATNLHGNYNSDSIVYSLETEDILILGISHPNIKFIHWYDFENNVDGGNVKISSDNGFTWDILYPISGYNLPSIPANPNNPLIGEPAFTGQNGFWEEVVFDLSLYTNFAALKFRWDVGVDQTNSGAGWYIDDFSLFDGTVVKRDDRFSSDTKLRPSIKNYPNPFNPVTTIKYNIPTTTNVSIEVYNVLGQKIQTLVDDYKPAGYHDVKFDATQLSSGIYLYRIQAGHFSQVKKMVVMK